MAMTQSKLKIPSLVNIDAYIKGDPSHNTDVMSPAELGTVLSSVQKEYGGEIYNENILSASKNGEDLFIKVIDREDFCVFTTIISPKDDNYISDDWTKDITDYSKEMQNILKLLPKKRIANLRVIATAGFKEEGMSEVFIKEYSTFFNKRINDCYSSALPYIICIWLKCQTKNADFFTF